MRSVVCRNFFSQSRHQRPSRFDSQNSPDVQQNRLHELEEEGTVSVDLKHNDDDKSWQGDTTKYNQPFRQENSESRTEQSRVHRDDSFGGQYGDIHVTAPEKDGKKKGV